MASLGAVLEQYPNEVVAFITDPRTGVQRGKVFPPTIADIVKAADSHVAWLRQQEEFRNWGRRPREIEPPRENRPSISEMKEKYGENWGLTSIDGAKKKPKPAPSKEDLEAHYREYALGFVRKSEATE